MNMLNAHKCGLVLGAFVALIHAVWSLLVAVGGAQAYVDFVFRLHMMRPFMVVLPFSIVTAIELVIVAGIVGYVIGFVLCSIWNKVIKMK